MLFVIQISYSHSCYSRIRARGPPTYAYSCKATCKHGTSTSCVACAPGVHTRQATFLSTRPVSTRITAPDRKCSKVGVGAARALPRSSKTRSSAAAAACGRLMNSSASSDERTPPCTSRERFDAGESASQYPGRAWHRYRFAGTWSRTGPATSSGKRPAR